MTHNAEIKTIINRLNGLNEKRDRMNNRLSIVKQFCKDNGTDYKSNEIYNIILNDLSMVNNKMDFYINNLELFEINPN